jgi:hypothetical protein
MQCHLRLSPENAVRLVGTLPDAASGMRVSVLSGRREEVYWEQVPEKVRRQAVEAACAEAARMRSAEEAPTDQQDNRGDGAGDGSGSRGGRADNGEDAAGVDGRAAVEAEMRGKKKRRRRK